MAKEILAGVGGQENIRDAEHCMTRLRFTLADNGKADRAAVEKVPGVLSVLEKGGQFQVVIGGEVPRVFSAYRELVGAPATVGASAAGGASAPTTTGADRVADGDSDTKKPNLLTRITETLSAIFVPIIPAIIGAGMLKGLLSTLQIMGVIDIESSTYVILNAVSDGPFYFLPVLIAFSAAKRFGMNQYVAVAIAFAALHPNLTALLTQAKTDGTVPDFFGLPVTPATYSSSVIAMFFTIWLASYVERFLDRHIHHTVRIIFSPMITILIMITLFITVIGPLGSIIGTALSSSIAFLMANTGPFGGIIMAVAWCLLVMVGMHYALVPVYLESLATQGFDYILVCITLANVAQGAAAIGALLRMRNRRMRPIALSAGITAFFGITEPVIYGVNLRYRRPFIAALVGAGIAGGFAMLFQTKAYVFVKPGIQGIPMFIGDTFWFAIIAMVISIAVAFLLAFFWGLPKGTDEPDAPEVEAAPGTVLAPLSGRIIPLADVDDAAFSSGVLGTGLAIDPTSDRVVSPVNGRIVTVLASGHAVGIVSDEGVELLIHVGVDTVRLQGEHFRVLVAAGDDVDAGTPLIEFDADAIRAAGYSLVTPVVVTSGADLSDVHAGEVVAGEALFIAAVPATAATPTDR
jgi:PTS system beta-glucosides-specific IIC component